MIKEPTEYPYECLDDDGEDTRVIGKSVMSNLYICEVNTGDGSFLCKRYLYELFDKPKVTSKWLNVCPNGTPKICYDSRESADSNAYSNRIGVLRVDTIDGVSTPHLEEI